jgi:hypothetical protein
VLRSIFAFVMSACALPALPTASAPAHTSSSTAGQTYDEHRDPPGGALAMNDRDCGPDVCLRAGTWFLVTRIDHGEPQIEAVFDDGGRWWSWRTGGELHGDVAYRTRAATADDLAPGTQVVFFGDLEAPTSETFAYANWRLDRVHSVDPALHTFQVGPTGSQPHPIDLARVIVETQPAPAKETP